MTAPTPDGPWTANGGYLFHHGTPVFEALICHGDSRDGLTMHERADRVAAALNGVDHYERVAAEAAALRDDAERQVTDLNLALAATRADNTRLRDGIALALDPDSTSSHVQVSSVGSSVVPSTSRRYAHAAVCVRNASGRGFEGCPVHDAPVTGQPEQIEGGVTATGEPDSNRSTDPTEPGRHTPPSPGPVAGQPEPCPTCGDRRVVPHAADGSWPCPDCTPGEASDG